MVSMALTNQRRPRKGRNTPYAQVLSSAMTSLAALLEDIGLQLNVAKTQAMFVLPRAHSLPPTLQIYCGDRALDIVSSYKYLGLYIDDGLT